MIDRIKSLLFRSREIELLKNKADRLEFENVDLRQRLSNCQTAYKKYVTDTDNTIRGLRGENTKRKDEIRRLKFELNNAKKLKV